MTINIEMMRQTFEYIETHPEEHDQATWAEQGPCGTTRCFAGTAVHLSKDYNIVRGSLLTCVRAADGRPAYFREAGTDILGLDDEQAEQMFYQAGDLDDLYDAAKRYTGIDFRDQVISGGEDA